MKQLTMEDGSLKTWLSNERYYILVAKIDAEVATRVRWGKYDDRWRSNGVTFGGLASADKH